MAKDPLSTDHPDKIDDVLEVPQPGTSDGAKTDPKKKDTTYKENTTSPDELISLDELYTTTGQERLEIVVDGWQELKHHQRLSRRHGDAVKLDTTRWIAFLDKSNGLRYGDDFINRLRQSSARTFINGQRFTRALLKRSLARSQTVTRLVTRLNNQFVAPLHDVSPSRSRSLTTKLTLFVRQGESIDDAVTRLGNTLQHYPTYHNQLVTWAQQVINAVIEVQQASDRSVLLNALQTFITYDKVPEGAGNLCQVFCGETREGILTPRQLYVATEKNLQFKDVELPERRETLTRVADGLVENGRLSGTLSLIDETTRALALLAQTLLETGVTPVTEEGDNELLFTFMEAQRTCSRLSMVLDMTQGLLQSLSVVLFTVTRARVAESTQQET